MQQTTYQYKLLEVHLNEGTVLRPDKLTVLVGPNNSGKSRALKEIASFATSSRPDQGIVVTSVSAHYPSGLGDLRQAYDVESYKGETGYWNFHTLSPDLSQEYNATEGSWPESFETLFQDPSRSHFQTAFAERFGKAMVAFLTTESRLRLVSEGASTSHYRQTSSLLQVLYNAGSDAARGISQVVQRTFGKEIALDFTIPQRLKLRVGDNFSDLPPDPRDAREKMAGYELLDEQGDGIRGFIAIVVALLVLKRSLFLIDEPEAFLHPPQAFRIGSFIAEQSDRSRQIILATHSADVLRGILSRTRDVDIVRVDRIGNINRFNRLDPNRLKEIINDPLLTSSRVLDGLFYSGAVVVEADSDARFYQSVSTKLAHNLDLHFVNAGGKQTVSRILRLYRDMGVRAAGIVDFDVLNDRTDLERALRLAGVSDADLPALMEDQRRIAEAAKEQSPENRLASVRAKWAEVEAQLNQVASQTFESLEEGRRAKETLLRKMENRFRELAELTKPWKAFKQAGRAALPPGTQVAFNHLWEECARHGFFVNPCGELESMLVDYGVPTTTDKKSWIVQALQLVPQLDPHDERYPWKFMKAIHRHLQTA